MATWLQSLGNLNNSLTDKFMAGGIGKGLGSLGITSGGIGGIANTIGNMATGLLAGQNQTGVGNIMQTVGGLASNIPGVGGLIGAGVSVVGGLVNAAFGSHINDEFVNQTNQQANALGSTVFNANTNGDLLNDWQNMTAQSNVSKSEVGSDGWFSNKAQDKTNELNARINEANRRQLANFGIAAENVDRQNDFRILQNMAAYGGPIGSFRKFYAKGGYLEQAKALIRQNEGFRDKPYNDAPKGKNWRSVGYGFNDSGFRDKYPEGISKHYERGITKKQAEEELDYFLKGAEKQLKNIYGSQWNSFTDSQKAAILDTYYQRPASVGKTSRFYKAVTAGEDPSRYLGVAGFTKRNNIRQNVFGGGEFTGVGYSDEYNPNGETGEITYPSSSSLLEATSPYYDLSRVTPTQAVNPTINLPTLDTNFLASFGQSQPTQQTVPTVGTVEDYLQAYGDNLDANMIFARGGFLGKKFDGEGEESQHLQVQRSPHVDLAVNNPWLYQKLHPTQTKAEKYEPTTFAGRVAQVAGVGERGQKYIDYSSSAVQQVPVVGLIPSALDLGYDTNRLYHKPSLTTTKDVTLDAASLVPALRKTMKGWWMKGNSGQFVTEAGQVINNPRLASSLEVALQPFRTAINTGVYAGRAADFVDDSKAYLKDMYNDSPIGKHFPIKANGGRLITKDRFDMNMFDFGGGLTHGSEFDTGINWVNEGDSHSQNPYGGVPYGTDEDGIPNLVEEGEAVWNGDYVFSRRMKVPKKLRDKYKLPEGATFADAVAKLTKESEERPLDEISRATQDHILGEFADSQEEMRMDKAQRAMDREMQLRDDFITGFNMGAFGGPLFSNGGGIHIDPSKKGTFKAQASRMGMGVQEAASHILANKENYSPAMVRKANFAKIFAHADGGDLFNNPFAYGGELGNIFVGEGDRPNTLNLDAANQSLVRRIFGDTGFTRFMENTSAALNDPLSYFAGDQIDAIMNRVAQMSQPQMEKFFSTSLGQAVAKGVVEADKYLSSGTGDNMQKAGVNRWYKATGRMAKPVYQATVNAAKKAMAQSRQAARGQMRTPKGGGSQKVLNETTTPVQQVRQPIRDSGLPEGWGVGSSNLGRASSRTQAFQRGLPKDTFDKGFGSARNLAGTLDFGPAPIGSGNFGYLPWIAGAGAGGYGIYRGADWLSDNLETGQPEVAAASMPTSTRQAQAPASNRGNVVAGGSSKGNRFLASRQQVPTSAASTRGTQAASVSGGGTGTRSVAPATPNRGNIVDFAYDWYRNGSDGLGEPTGFKVGSNGRAYDYTKEYTDLVNRLGADDIRKWAAEHPNDPSLRSFLANGNKLENLTDEQWRKGATDGKYGFMHHVADNMLNNVSFNPPEIEREPASTSAITDAVRQAIARDGYTSEPTAQDADIVNALTPDTAIRGKSFNPRPTWMRQVPIWLSGIMGLKEMLTPADYGNADAITEAAYQSGQPVSVGTEYIGDYRKRDPFDQHYLENIINQRGAATNRNMMNFSGGNRAVGMAGILANDLVTQQGLAEAARQGYIANRTDDAQVSEFNRGTNLANMQAQNTRNLALAQLNSQRKNAMLSGIAQGARLRQAIKDQRDAAISANWTNFAQGLGDWGKENGFYNMLGGLNEEGVLKYFFGDNYKTRFNNTSNV